MDYKYNITIYKNTRQTTTLTIELTGDALQLFKQKTKYINLRYHSKKIFDHIKNDNDVHKDYFTNTKTTIIHNDKTIDKLLNIINRLKFHTFTYCLKSTGILYMCSVNDFHMTKCKHVYLCNVLNPIPLISKICSAGMISFNKHNNKNIQDNARKYKPKNTDEKF